MSFSCSSQNPIFKYWCDIHYVVRFLYTCFQGLKSEEPCPPYCPTSPKHTHTFTVSCALLCLVTQSCSTLCDPMGYSLPGSSVHGDSPGKNSGMGCHGLLQGIFPLQGSHPDLPHPWADSFPSQPPGSHTASFSLRQPQSLTETHVHQGFYYILSFCLECPFTVIYLSTFISLRF